MTLLEALNVFDNVESTRGAMHLGAALLALALGPVVLARPKGNAAHRTIGRLWVVAMLIVDLSALMIWDLNTAPGLFHVFAVLNLSALIPGLLAIRHYQRTGAAGALQKHLYCMHWAYFGVASAGVWQFSSRLAAVLPVAVTTADVLWSLGAATMLASAFFSFWLAQRYPSPLR